MTSNKSAESGREAGERHVFPRKVENMIAAFRGLPESDSRAKDRGVRELGPLIDQILDKYQIGRSSPEERLRQNWTGIVGTANAAYSHPLHIARGTLQILTSHAVVRSELQLHNDEILDRVRSIAGCEGVRRLSIRHG